MTFVLSNFGLMSLQIWKFCIPHTLYVVLPFMWIMGVYRVMLGQYLYKISSQFEVYMVLVHDEQRNSFYSGFSKYKFILH